MHISLGCKEAVCHRGQPCWMMINGLKHKKRADLTDLRAFSAICSSPAQLFNGRLGGHLLGPPEKLCFSGDPGFLNPRAE